VVEEAHDLKNTSGARGNNGRRINTTRAEGNTKVHKGIYGRKRNIIEGQADRRRGGRMVDYGAFGGIPAVTKGKGVVGGKRKHRLDRGSGTKKSNVISKEKTVQRSRGGRRRGRRGNRMSDRSGDRTE
jgi:hypothetical protein